MKLYEEVIFLKHHFNGKYCVENVVPYYDYFLNPYKRDRHLYWTNFTIPNTLSQRSTGKINHESRLPELCELHDYDFTKYKGEQRVLKIARNLVDYKAGKTILECALGTYRPSTNQIDMFR